MRALTVAFLITYRCNRDSPSQGVIMSEEENVSVEDGQPQAIQPEENQDDVSKETQEAEQRKRNDAEYNWGEMRRQMKEKDYQIEELRHQFSQIEKRSPTPDEVDELANLAEDDILTVAQARKLASKTARSIAEDVIKKREAATVDERVQLKFSDYTDVVTKENIELLKQIEPELAQSLYHIPDPYNQAVAAYKLLKKVAVKKDDSNSLERKKATENLNKPQSVNTVTKNSAIGNAHLFEN